MYQVFHYVSDGIGEGAVTYCMDFVTGLKIVRSASRGPAAGKWVTRMLSGKAY